MMGDSPDTVRIARKVIENFGDRAAEIMDKRAQENAGAGHAATATLWRDIAAAVRRLQGLGGAALAGFRVSPRPVAPPPPPARPEAEARKAVDAHIGTRLRLRRTIIGMTQQQLAADLGVSFQQVQKYECGANRIAGSTLWSLTRLLGVPIAYFFDGLEPAEQAWQPPQPGDRSIMRRKTLELVRAFMALPVAAREAAYEFIIEVARPHAGATHQD